MFAIRVFHIVKALRARLPLDIQYSTSPSQVTLSISGVPHIGVNPSCGPLLYCIWATHWTYHMECAWGSLLLTPHSSRRAPIADTSPCYYTWAIPTSDETLLYVVKGRESMLSPNPVFNMRVDGSPRHKVLQFDDSDKRAMLVFMEGHTHSTAWYSIIATVYGY